MEHTKTTIILILFLSSAAAVTEKCHPHDKAVLFRILKSFNEPDRFDPWKNVDCCRWYSVKCDYLPPYRVISFSFGTLSNNTITIPSALGDLPYLQDLTFRKLPNLVGTIPSSLAKLQRLKSAQFDHNSLSGPVPSFFYRMAGLTVLDLSFNQFSGSIPPQIGLAPSLVSIDISRNLLSGPIPESFGHFKMGGRYGNLFSLRLSHNQLSGPIPTSLGNINFVYIDLSRNNLTGDASFLFGTNKSDVGMDLSGNELSFNFSSVEIQAAPIGLDLSHNQIFGGFPVGMENVHVLNVSYNRLCGTIPSVGWFSTFDQSVFVHNKCLCGAPLAGCN